MEFWNSKNIKKFRIEDPKIYNAEILSPDYLQEKELSSSKVKKLRNEWQKVLPKLEKLQFLYLGHRVNQEYFEAVCEIPNLKGLWVKTSQIKDFSNIGNLKKLEQLNFGGSLAITNLNGIQNLTNLRYCVLDNFFGIETLNELSNLNSLEKLNLFAGADKKTLNIKSIEPISVLRNLKELSLAIKTNLDIQPLLKLKELDILIVPEFYHSLLNKELPKQTELR